MTKGGPSPSRSRIKSPGRPGAGFEIEGLFMLTGGSSNPFGGGAKPFAFAGCTDFGTATVLEAARCVAHKLNPGTGFLSHVRNEHVGLGGSGVTSIWSSSRSSMVSRLLLRSVMSGKGADTFGNEVSGSKGWSPLVPNGLDCPHRCCRRNPWNPLPSLGMLPLDT